MEDTAESDQEEVGLPDPEVHRYPLQQADLIVQSHFVDDSTSIPEPEPEYEIPVFSKLPEDGRDKAALSAAAVDLPPPPSPMSDSSAMDLPLPPPPAELVQEHAALPTADSITTPAPLTSQVATVVPAAPKPAVAPKPIIKPKPAVSPVRPKRKVPPPVAEKKKRFPTVAKGSASAPTGPPPASNLEVAPPPPPPDFASTSAAEDILKLVEENSSQLSQLERIVQEEQIGSDLSDSSARDSDARSAEPSPLVPRRTDKAKQTDAFTLNRRKSWYRSVEVDCLADALAAPPPASGVRRDSLTIPPPMPEAVEAPQALGPTVDISSVPFVGLQPIDCVARLGDGEEDMLFLVGSASEQIRGI